jgi:type IV pilus assembly protein PilW
MGGAIMILRKKLPSVMRGLSMVELMVAMTIGLAILASVSAVFVNSKSNYVSQESNSRLQETARFATYFLMRDLRLAGYYGCLDDISSVNSRLAGSPTRFNPVNPIEGNRAGTALWYPSGDATDFTTTGTAVTALAADCPNKVGGRCTGSDAVTVRFADPDTLTTLSSSTVGTGGAVNVTSTSNYSTGNVIVIADCSNADIAQITGIAGNAISHAGSSGTPGNTDANLSHVYSAQPSGSTDVMRYSVHRYYIGTGKSGHPALFRQNVVGSSGASASILTEEMVEGVEKMQVLYGLDTDALSDRNPNAYLQPDHASLAASSARWGNVVSARLVLTVRPIADPNVNQSSTTTVTGVTPKTFATTVVLRNLQ